MPAITEIEVAVKRCDPVEGSQFQTYDKRLTTMSRDELKMLVNQVNSRRLGSSDHPMVKAINDEWNGRFEHWAKVEIKKVTAVIEADTEFRLEVIEELVASGIARHVAANLTNTEAKLMAKAREIGYI